MSYDSLYGVFKTTKTYSNNQRTHHRHKQNTANVCAMSELGLLGARAAGRQSHFGRLCSSSEDFLSLTRVIATAVHRKPILLLRIKFKIKIKIEPTIRQ